MRFETTDPITGNDVADLDHAPFVIEGSGDDALKIYFESEASRQAFLEISVKYPDEGLIRSYNQTTDKSMEM